MEEFIGNIKLYPYNFAPMDTLLCNGQLVNIVTSQALFSLIGTTYGGNGSTNFAVPNMLGLEPIPGMNYYIMVNGIYPVRD